MAQLTRLVSNHAKLHALTSIHDSLFPRDEVI